MSNIRDERRLRGWSQTVLAFHARMCTADISKIESGRLKPSPGQVQRIAQAFGVRPEKLFGVAEHN